MGYGREEEQWKSINKLTKELKDNKINKMMNLPLFLPHSNKHIK